MEADLRMQEAKELTEELLNHHNNDWAGSMVDECGKQMEFNKGQIALFEDAAPAEPMDAEETTSEDAPVRAQMSSGQGGVFFKPSPGGDPGWL